MSHATELSVIVGFSTDGLSGTGARRRARTGAPELERERDRNVENVLRFRKVLMGKLSLRTLPIDLEESELLEVLEELESFDMHVFEKAGSSVQRMRANIRYLAALWPEATTIELAHRIHALINNRNISFSDIMTIIRGERLSETAQMQDLRVVLSGGKVGNAQEKTNEVPVPIIQGVGRCLKEGMSLAETSRVMHISVDTVRAIENLLGIRSAYTKRLIDSAVDAAREQVSVRTFAGRHNISKGRAEALLRQGRSVLVELGEAQ